MATTSYREIGLLPPVFTEEEIQQELDRLGITNIDKASLRQFRHELQDLIQEVSASSPGFPETSSSTSDVVVVGSSYNQTGSDMFTEDEVEADSMAKSPPSSSLSVPSPLLTPPLGDSNSCDVFMGRKKPGDDDVIVGDLINCRRVWGDDKSPGIEPPLRKYPQLGRERQINLNSKLNHRGRGSISPETQLLENVSPDKRSTTTPLEKDVPFSSLSNFTSNNPKISDFNPGSSNPDVNKSDNPVASYSRPTRSPPQPFGERNDNAIKKSEISSSTNERRNKDGCGVTVVQSNDSGSLLDELLRSYNSENKSLKNNFVKTAAAAAPKQMTKRKIARKDNQGKTYVDESYTDSETGSLLDPAEYFERLREINKTVYDDIAAAAAASEESSDFYPRSESAFFSNTYARPKSVILTPVTPPKLKKNKKSDPVNRYQQFRDYWAHHKVPGENKHSEIRWIIKEKMLQQDDIIESRPRKVYVANNYVVPTEKHRSSLRWQIRTDLAYGLMPSLKDNYSHF